MKVFIKKITGNSSPHIEAHELLKEIYGKEFSLGYNEHSKPYIINDSNFHFNISHSSDYVCLAFSNNEVGIDIEKHTKNRMYLAKRYFSPDEQSACVNNIGSFYDIWTMKEAYVKARGIGLSYGLNKFSVLEKQRGFDIKNLHAPKDYSLSVCEETDEITDIEIIKL